MTNVCSIICPALPDNDTIRRGVVAEAHSWIGTPFHYQACVKSVGVACGAFLIACYAANGINVPSVDSLPYFAPDWAMHTREERFLDIVDSFSRRVDVPLPGDTAMFQCGWTYSHAGIVVEWPMLIHAVPGAGVSLVNAAIDAQCRKGIKPVIFLSPWNRVQP